MQYESFWLSVRPWSAMGRHISHKIFSTEDKSSIPTGSLPSVVAAADDISSGATDDMFSAAEGKTFVSAEV